MFVLVEEIDLAREMLKPGCGISLFRTKGALAMMKKAVLASAIATLLAAPATVMAQAAAPGSSAAPEVSEHTLTGNLAIVTDYRFRGISQTFGGSNFWAPAVQGGVDYSHSSGFYVGNWNSNVSGTQYPNGSSIEMDFYGGWKGTWDDFGLDVGTLYYYYPNSAKFVGTNASGSDFSKTINNWEVYVGGSWKFLSLKYFYSFTDYFGLSSDVASVYFNQDGTQTLQTASGSTGGTKGTQYLTASATYEVMPKVNLIASAGYTWLGRYGGQLDYFDYKIGATYDWNGWVFGIAGVGTNADKQWWYAVNSEGKVRDLGKFN